MEKNILREQNEYVINVHLIKLKMKNILLWNAHFILIEEMIKTWKFQRHPEIFLIWMINQPFWLFTQEDLNTLENLGKYITDCLEIRRTSKFILS